MYFCSSNEIKVIENLEFLEKLTKLDLSYNQIPIEELERCLPFLPKSLQFIDISGNPCVQHAEKLVEIQKKHPEIVLFSNKAVSKDTVVDPATDIEVTPLVKSISDVSNSIDSDPIIKELVERKCNLQNAESSNLSTVYNVENIRKETDLLSLAVENMFSAHREANKLRSNEYMNKLDVKFQALKCGYDANKNGKSSNATVNEPTISSSTNTDRIDLRAFAEQKRKEIIQKRLNDSK